MLKSPQAQICEPHCRKSPDRRDKSQDQTIFQGFRRSDLVFPRAAFRY
jgi:hypothetical protein